ncbi:MAG: hypothetical protein ACYDDT_12165 [Sulfuricella sp.]
MNDTIASNCPSVSGTRISRRTAIVNYVIKAPAFWKRLVASSLLEPTNDQN